MNILGLLTKESHKIKNTMKINLICPMGLDTALLRLKVALLAEESPVLSTRIAYILRLDAL